MRETYQEKTMTETRIMRNKVMTKLNKAIEESKT